MPAIREADEAFLTRELPKVSPAAVLPLYPHTPYSPISGHMAPQLPLDVTQVLPVVTAPRRSVDTAATQLLPVAVDMPPSVMHADPTRWHDRTHVEDNDLEPESRGRHVLDGLKAEQDPALELAQAEQRVVSAMVTGVPRVKNPAMRLAVRMFREARDMGRARESRLAQDDARLDATDARIKAFAERWAHDDAHWDRVAQVLKAKQEASDAGQLTAVYDADGTAAALYKVDELSHEIVQRARAKAGVR
ncbi:hypothetical protein [Catenulispora acidiphila]|nr:hypothetical protein [Catenulispora acidiphila]